MIVRNDALEAVAAFLFIIIYISYKHLNETGELLYILDNLKEDPL
jgi:hypothetical protein